jgi:hypothetical protein
LGSVEGRHRLMTSRAETVTPTPIVALVVDAD